MFRFQTVTALALISSAALVAAVEPNLRIPTALATTEDGPSGKGDGDCAWDEDWLNRDDDNDVDCDDMKGFFQMEKGFQCKGGFESHKFGGKKCTGGAKGDFHAEHTTEFMSAETSAALLEHFDTMSASNQQAILQQSPEMFTELDDLALNGDELEDGFSKTIEFGGMMRVDWGCKVVFEKKDGKFHKHTECGVKGRHGMGVKPSGHLEEL